MIIKSFDEWLETNTDVIPYSVRRYSGTIPLIMSELESYGLGHTNLLEINDPDFIDDILNNEIFQVKNRKGNRMYSAALKHFKKYVEYRNEIEYETAVLNEEYSFQSHLQGSDETDEALDLNVNRDVPDPVFINRKKIWKRNPKVARKSLEIANYACEINPNHKHFISKFSNENYVEAHHIIPMEYPREFENNLDTYGNVVALCMVCHKRIHFDSFENKKSLLKKLYTERKVQLSNSGIEIELEDLYQMYQD